MLRNLHINGLRRKSHSTVVKSVDDLHDGEGAEAPQQEHHLSTAEIGEALNRLPAQQREILLLIGLEEMSYREAAEITGVPIGTVMSRLSRARGTLKDILEQRGHTVLRRVK
jgi:RNA polymerase sigma-70 factor (ECF subfamily)